MTLSVDGQRATYAALHDLAHRLAGGRWVATGGGGYALVDVVPRAWAHLVGIVAGRPVDPETPIPEDWRSYVLERLGRIAPERMTDGRDVTRRQGAELEADIDAAIRAAQAEHGLGSA